MAFTLTACNSEPKIPTVQQLEQFEWQLTNLDGDSVLSGTQVTFIIREQRLSGSAGANRYTASWELANNQIVISPIAATKRLAIEPKGIMTQETKYLQLLQTMQFAEINDYVLRLSNKEGQLLEFIPLPER